MAISRRSLLTQTLSAGSAALLAGSPLRAGPAGRFTFDFDRQNPFEWLIALALAKVSGQPSIVIGDAPKDWLKPHHIDSLFEMVQSKTECASVSSRRSSNRDDYNVKTASTVGHEARYLIASYRHGLFPMSHKNSSSWPMDP